MSSINYGTPNTEYAKIPCAKHQHLVWVSWKHLPFFRCHFKFFRLRLSFLLKHAIPCLCLSKLFGFSKCMCVAHGFYMMCYHQKCTLRCLEMRVKQCNFKTSTAIIYGLQVCNSFHILNHSGRQVVRASYAFHIYTPCATLIYSTFTFLSVPTLSRIFSLFFFIDLTVRLQSKTSQKTLI